MAWNKSASRRSSRCAAVLLCAIFLDAFSVIQAAQGPTKAPAAPPRTPGKLVLMRTGARYGSDLGSNCRLGTKAPFGQ